MLYIKVKKTILASMFMFLASSVLFAANSYALFDDLTQSGTRIFTGMREVIYAVSGFGIIGIAIGGFFGKINWKWLGAVIIGLMVIALTALIVNYMVDQSVVNVTGALISASGE